MNRKIVVAALFLVSGCGGGGGGDSVTLPSNAAPQFTSTATVSLVENASFSYTAAASDANGDALTFSIGGGPDAARFAITPGGVLTFVRTPDFDDPADADADNIYRVTLAASDGKSTTSLPLTVTVTNSREGIAVRRVFSDFNQPVVMTMTRAGGDLYVGERDGTVYRIDTTSNGRTLHTRVTDHAPISGDKIPVGPAGLLGLAAIDAIGGGTLYASFGDRAGNLRVRAFDAEKIRLNAPDYASDVMTIAGGTTDTNIAAWLGADRNNTLYLATGSGAGANDPRGTAQDDASWLGKLIRIRRNPDPYGGATPNFYLFDLVAKGLRQPVSGTFYDLNLLLGDQGQSQFGEVHRYGGVVQPALNFGWPYREGMNAVPGAPPSPAGLTNPVLEVAFGTGLKQGNALIVGPYYAGPVASLCGLMLFADHNSGAIWTTPAEPLASGNVLAAGAYARRDADFVPDVGTIDHILGFAGNGFRYYILDRDGELFEVVAGS